MKIEQTASEIKITILEKENYTLEDLKQNLINKLNTQINNNGDLSLFNKEIELLKIILENEKD